MQYRWASATKQLSSRHSLPGLIALTARQDADHGFPKLAAGGGCKPPAGPPRAIAVVPGPGPGTTAACVAILESGSTSANRARPCRTAGPSFGLFERG